MAAKAVKVSQLNAYIKRKIQNDPLLGDVTVTGEVSNLKFHGSGHIYFSLKDESSKINCFVPQEAAIHMDSAVVEGGEITVNGYLYVYERGGSYSINIRSIENTGTGSLAIAFEKLKNKLRDEGLFDKEHKKRLPAFPKSVAIVTSDSGDAVQDIIKIIRSRNNYTDIYICPVLVQGPKAAADISSMIDEINETMPFLDCIITGRGGGSMEELWAFNEEIVARSIFASKIPVISAVGHETDYCISDFTADVRAETPTAAAMAVAPDLNELRMYIDDVSDSLENNINRILKSLEAGLSGYDNRIMETQMMQRLELGTVKAETLMNSITFETESKIAECERRASEALTIIANLSPGNIMKKGYGAVTDSGGRFVKSVSQLAENENISIRLYDGEAKARIEGIDYYGEDKL